MIKEYKSDENVKSGQAFKAREAELNKEKEETIKDRINNKKKEVILNAAVSDDDGNIKYSFSDGETIKNYTTKAYDTGVDEDEIRTIGEKQYYRGFPLDAVVVNEKAIRTEVEDEYRDNINYERLEYNEKYDKNKERIDKLKNLKFAVVNRSTGEVFTNMGDNITAQTDLLSLVKADGWSIAVQNGVFSSGKDVNRDNYVYLYNGEEHQLVSFLNKVFANDGYDAFFELNGDVFVTGNGTKMLQKGDEYHDLQQKYLKQLANVEKMKICAVVSLLVLIITVVLLCILAGKVDEQGNTKRAPIDRIYNDIHFVVSLGLVIGFLALTIVFCETLLHTPAPYSDLKYNAMFIGGGAMVAVAAALFIEWLMSVFRHVRCKTYWGHTLINMLFIKSGKKLKEICKSTWNKLKGLFAFQETKNLKTKMLQIISGYAGANLILAIIFAMLVKNHSNGFAFFVALIMIGVNLYFVNLAKSTIKALDDMMEVLIEAENGRFDFNLDVYLMPRYLQDFAMHIVNLREGIKIAVDEAVKGERMKTELITNVSHDLKTPLTSIISYVDLLKRCELQDEAAKSYVEILEEKSERLKKLIEDLLEASKISSGNVKLELTKVNLNEFTIQLAGENEGELTNLGIELRVSNPKSPPIVKADSQKAYRAIENLFSNVKKYAMPGTRVYVDVLEDEKYGIISIKNISKNELDISSEQLIQRFVRGDTARATEGNGLGLSIAENLINLQNGEFKIDIDGDLFKVTIKLPIDK